MGKFQVGRHDGVRAQLFGCRYLDGELRGVLCASSSAILAENEGIYEVEYQRAAG